MPHEITERRALLEALAQVDCLSELLERHEKHFKHELDLEVIVYGRGYTGGPVGPYARLWQYRAEETVTHKDDWAGNSFYILVDGELEVLDDSPLEKVGCIARGQIFGEMSIIEGDQRSKTVRVPKGAEDTTVIELQRPALRLLRKLPEFERVFDEIYLRHGLNNTLCFLEKRVGVSLAPVMLERLGRIAQFKVYGSRHPLVAEGAPIEDVLFINKGWVEIVRGLADGAATSGLVKGLDESADVRFLGAGNCLGLEAEPDASTAAAWPYSATAQARRRRGRRLFSLSTPEGRRGRAAPARRDERRELDHPHRTQERHQVRQQATVLRPHGRSTDQGLLQHERQRDSRGRGGVDEYRHWRGD